MVDISKDQTQNKASRTRILQNILPRLRALDVAIHTIALSKNADHQLMRELAESGMTMLVVTHEMGFAKAAADRMVFFDDGKIVETGTPEQIFENPQHDRTKLFLSQILH